MTLRIYNIEGAIQKSMILILVKGDINKLTSISAVAYNMILRVNHPCIANHARIFQIFDSVFSQISYNSI